MPIGTHVRHGRTSLPMPVYTPDQAQQELFSRRLGADEFEITTAPPRVGFWGLTFRDKQRLSTEIAPTNLAAWIATGQNRVLAFLGLAEERKYVSLGTAMAMRQAAHGSNTADTPEDVEQMNVFRWLGNRIRPVQDVTELTQQLTFVDEDFDPEKALAEFQEASPHMVALFEQRGLDLREYLGEAPNAIAFQYRTNQALARIEAEGRVGQYNGEVGLIRNFSSKMLSGVGNYLLTDPTIVPSMLTPFSLAAGAARGGRIVGTAAHRAGVPTGIAARTSQVIGLPTAAHRAIAGRMGAGAAGALELGLFGAGFNAIDQHQRVQHYNDLYDSEMFQQEFSWGEFALAVGLTSTLGFVIGHATRHRATPTSRRNAVAAIEDHADEHPTAHSHSPQAHAAQAEIDDARVTIARLSGQIADDGDEGHYLFLTDLRFLEQSGLDLAGVSGVMSNLVANVDTGRMTAREAQGVLDSFITEARRRATRIAASPEHQLLRKAKARAATRRAEELGVRVTHLKHDRIDWANPTMRRLLKEEYDQLKAHYDSRPNGVHAVDSTPHEASTQPAAAPTAVTEANRRHNREMNAYYRRQAEGRDLTDAELEDWMAVRRRLGDEARSPTYNQLTARPLREADVSALLDTWAARARKAEETAMVARLDEADAALEGAGITTHRQVREKWAKNPPRTLAEREQALDEQMTALVRGASDDYVDANWFTAVTRHLGPLTGWVDTLAAARTGKGLTVKSAFQALRALAEELDHTRHSVRTLEDGGGSVVGTAADSNRESLRLMAPMVHRMEKIRQSGKLSGNWGMDLQKIQDFETAIVRHVRKTELSDDPDVQWFAREWERIRDRIGAEGLRNGFFSGLAENYFPHRIRPGMAQSDRLKLIDTLSDLYRTKWMQSSSVHRDTLVDLGYLHRTESGPRGQADWALTDRGREVFGDTIPTRRADLPENVQPEYERALALPVEGQQYSAIERSMRRAVNRLTTTAQTETDGAGRLVVETHRRPVENEAATFLAEAAQDPRMEEFLDMSFFANTRNYLNRVGFSVLNQTRHQTRWGVPGLTMRETAQFARKKLLEAAETPDQVTQVNDGVDIIMRKIAGLEGSLPSVISASNKIGQVGGETAAAATVAAIGPGVGLSTLVESMANMVFQAQSPLDIVRNVGNFLRGMNPVRHRERFQERMGDMALVLEMNNHHTLNRMSMGMFESDLSWDFTTKLWTPWQGLGQTATGATEVAARTRAGRWGVLPKGMQALAGMQYQLGGADYVTHVTRSVAAVAQLRQTARYMPAARRLGELLDQNKTRLARVREDARQAAVRRGRSEGEVDLAGDNAVHREFKGLARQAGFGHRWNIAADMQQHGLLNRGILDAMEAAGEATGGITRTRFRQYLDPQRLASGMDDMSPEQASLVQEGIRRLQNQVERNINRRVSMPGIHQRATDEADRSWYGKVSMVLTGFARSWWQNNVIDMANMPTRTGIALMGSFITSQIMLNSIRRVLRGETVDEVMAEAEENPYRYALTNAAYLPMLGPYNMMIGWSIDSAFGDTPWRQDVNSGVSGRVMNDTFDLAQATVRAPAQAAAGEETDIPGAALRAGSMFIPGYNSWWWNSLGLSYRKAMEDQPHQSLFPTRTDPSRQVPFQPGSIEPETSPRPSDDEVRELISSLGLSEN